MHAIPHWCYRPAPRWYAAGVALALAFAPTLPAQTDTLKPTIALSLAAGPSIRVGPSAGAARVGYIVQGSLARMLSTSPWRVRADVIYQHVGDVGEHTRYRSDWIPGESGDAWSTALAFASVARTHRLTPHVRPYLLGGVGGGWVDEMRMDGSLALGRGAVRFAWQAGAGVEWMRGERALTLEGRVQSARAALGQRWYTTAPVLFGVRW